MNNNISISRFFVLNLGVRHFSSLEIWFWDFSFSFLPLCPWQDTVLYHLHIVDS